MTDVFAFVVRPAELMEEYRRGLSWAEMAARRNAGSVSVVRQIREIVLERITSDDVDERTAMKAWRRIKAGVET